MLRSFRTYVRQLFYRIEPELRSKTIKFKHFEAKVFGVITTTQVGIPDQFADSDSLLKLEAILSPHIVKLNLDTIYKRFKETQVSSCI